jgi:hypothetical protein
VIIGDNLGYQYSGKPYSMKPLTAAEQFDTGVTPELVRLSVGIEGVLDIIGDLAQAIEAAHVPGKSLRRRQQSGLRLIQWAADGRARSYI